MSKSKAHHYVPQWYQRQFLKSDSSEAKYFYLDLHPATAARDGHLYVRRALRKLGPPTCFVVDDLYTTRLRSGDTDILERRFFGEIDTKGQQAVTFFGDYRYCDAAHENFQPFMDYLDIQIWRTVKGLTRLALSGGMRNHSRLLMHMQSLHQAHVTMWTEAEWEVFACADGAPRLLVTDAPVSFYNRACYPGAPESRSPMEPDIAWAGTQTLFALRPDRLLVLTHRSFAMDPSVNARRPRPNARFFQQTMFDLRSIITGRTLSVDDVLKVNFILKSRAHRYIAAADEADLYPERRMSTTHWGKLGTEDFLLPDPRDLDFTTGIVVGFKDGRSWARDEYGRPMKETPAVRQQRDREWAARDRRRKEWDAKYGPKDDPFWMRRMRHPEPVDPTDFESALPPRGERKPRA